MVVHQGCRVSLRRVSSGGAVPPASFDCGAPIGALSLTAVKPACWLQQRRLLYRGRTPLTPKTPDPKPRTLHVCAWRGGQTVCAQVSYSCKLYMPKGHANRVPLIV
eukprot:3332620-Pleurochrysis_carterae.AAC.3